MFFDVPPAQCKARVAARTDHPTIPFGRGARIVQSFADKLQVRCEACNMRERWGKEGPVYTCVVAGVCVGGRA